MREVLTVDEVAALLQATPSPTYKAMFHLSYASGLRLAELLAVEVSHLDPGNGGRVDTARQPVQPGLPHGDAPVRVARDWIAVPDAGPRTAAGAG